jgi:hypothetical protein
MKLKSFLLVLSFGLFTQAFAANVHLNPSAKAEATNNKAEAKNLTYPGYCQIEIINNSYSDINVYGRFDDGSTINFNIYRFEYPHYISLDYGYYCHEGMDLIISSRYSTLYNSYTYVNSTVRIVPYLKDQAKATITVR